MKQFCPQGHDTLIVGRTNGKACKKCRNQRTKEWIKRNPVYKAAAHKRWRASHWQEYRAKHAARIQESARKQEWKGILNMKGEQFTSRDYDIAFIAQEEKCANVFCRRQSNLHMDHDHKTMSFRGLLCQGCNRALGMCQDDPNKLLGLAGYLKSKEIMYEEINIEQETGC